jgi:hypothetical protein
LSRIWGETLLARRRDRLGDMGRGAWRGGGTRAKAGSSGGGARLEARCIGIEPPSWWPGPPLGSDSGFHRMHPCRRVL